MSLKDKLNSLKAEEEQIETDVKGVNGNHSEMMDNLSKIEGFVKDSKEAIEKEAEENPDTMKAYDELKVVIDRLKSEVSTLKTQNIELRNKIASIAGICAFSGTTLGVVGSLEPNIGLTVDLLPISGGKIESFQFVETLADIKDAPLPVRNELVKSKFFNVMLAVERAYYKLELEKNKQELGDKFNLENWNDW
ncbi:10180_t:CDS:2 [Entrophospora sp. SA101]|nr:10180_t:CDS:2 [Entrophospora sp. SA101]